MNQKLFMIVIIVFASIVTTVKAQVRVGGTPSTTTPANIKLHVVGNLKLSGELFLEKPGGFKKITNQDFLLKTKGGVVRLYDISAAKYAPINHVIYEFNNLGNDGLRDYNTKIPVAKYFVALQSFHMADTSMVLRDTSGNDRVQGLVLELMKKGGLGGCSCM